MNSDTVMVKMSGNSPVFDTIIFYVGSQLTVATATVICTPYVS